MKIKNIEITNEDNITLMSKYTDKYFDLAIVDPPYGIGRDGQKQTITKISKHKRKYHKQKNWDNEIPTKEYFNELFRVSKNQIIWGANYFVKYLSKGTMGWIVWDKGQHGLSMSDCEIAYSSFNKATRIVTINRTYISQYGGSIAIACYDMDFNLTACEIDKEYYNLAVKRLKQFSLQQKLF